MATFGNLSEGTIADNGWEGFHGASKFTAPANGTITDLTFWVVHATGGTLTCNTGIWADLSGLPGARLGTVQTSHVYVSGADEQLTASGYSVAITNGTPYWLGVGFVSDGTSHANLLVVSGGDIYYKPNGTADDPFGATPSHDTTGGWPIFATYTAAAAVQVPRPRLNFIYLRKNR